MTNRTALINSLLISVSAMDDTTLVTLVTMAQSLCNGKQNVSASKKSEPVVSVPEKEYTVRRCVGFVEQRDNTIAFLSGKFCPKPVFNGITYALKNAGAKYDTKTKAWTFEKLEDANAFMDAQTKREEERKVEESK